MPELEQQQVDGLPIVWKDSASVELYEKCRVGRVFNHRRPSRYPVAVVEATKPEHVLEAVRLANRLGHHISVRSGGHSWAAWSVRDNAILIDLGKLNHLDFDEAAGIVAVSPSTTGRMLNAVLSQRGYMFAGGHCPDVGLGGFLLQGGMGWNCKNWGWACEQIAAMDVVTAAGKSLRIDDQNHSDLFWAARGAGPGFPAIVTRFYLRVRRAYAGMMASTFIYPIARYREVMKWVTNLAPDYGHDTEIVAVSACPPGLDQRCIIAHLVTFQDDMENSIKALQLANETRPEDCLVQVTNEPTSLAKEYADQADANPEGHRYCAENAYVNNDEDVVEVLEESFTTLPHRKAFALWFAMAPCSRRRLPDMALDMQTDHYFALYTIWEHAADDERCQTWVRDVMSRVAPHGTGAYLGDSDFEVRRPDFWSKSHAKRLAEVRRHWNPEGRICGYLGLDDSSTFGQASDDQSDTPALDTQAAAANGDVTVVSNGHRRPLESGVAMDLSAKDAASQADAAQTLAGKVAVISGSSSGIGKAIAIELSSRGASIVINYPFLSLQSEAEAVQKQLRTASIAICADIGTTDGPGQLIDATIAEFGTVDIVVNNAALAVNKPFEEQTLQDWESLVNLNGRGTFLLTQAALRHMRKPGGRIVNICSASSRAAPPMQTIYAGTKGMVDSFTRCWAKELPPQYGCTVNAVSPGPTRTEGFSAAGAEVMKILQPTIDAIPVGARLAEGSEIAYAVAFLCEDRARWINGLHLHANGGLVID